MLDSFESLVGGVGADFLREFSCYIIRNSEELFLKTRFEVIDLFKINEITFE